MPRPNRVIGHLTPWVEYADELEAENAELRRMVEHVAYYSLDNMPPDVRAAAQALLEE